MNQGLRLYFQISPLLPMQLAPSPQQNISVQLLPSNANSVRMPILVYPSFCPPSLQTMEYSANCRTCVAYALAAASRSSAVVRRHEMPVISQHAQNENDEICNKSNCITCYPKLFPKHSVPAKAAHVNVAVQTERYAPRSYTNLIVTYLPSDMMESELYRIFNVFGEIRKCKIVMDANTMRSRCYGFVHYFRSSDAVKAIKWVDGLAMRGKVIRVNYARYNNRSMHIRNTQVFVGNIPVAHATEGNVRNIFAPFGRIIDISFARDHLMGRFTAGFVRFDTHQQAAAAISSLNGKIMFNRSLVVRWVEPRSYF